MPPGRVVPDSGAQFCCAGCEAVWQILHSCNLEEYYRLRDAFDEGRQAPARVTGKSFEYLDDPEYLARFADTRHAEAVRVELYLDGVHCVACTWLVEKVLMEIAGARFAQLNLGKSVVEIVFDPQAVKLSRIAQALDRIGYTPHPVIQDSDSTARRREARRMLARMGIAGASAMNIQLLAISQYAGDFTGIEAGYSSLFSWISLGLTLPVVTYSAWPFFRGAWHGLRRKLLHMDLPISLGILAAFAVSLAATLQNSGHVYYDTVTGLIFLLLVGRFVLQRASRWAALASENFLALTPKAARRIEPDGVREVLLTDVRPGDRLQVLPGDVVPVDGTLESPQAWIREAHLTGEPGAVKKTYGETVYAGSTVEQAPLELATTAVGETTRLWGLAQMMRDAATRRAPITMVMDRIAGWFVGTVLSLAALTALLWLFIDPSRALWNAAALMVVTCPCALGLATPVALAMAMGRAARHGLFIRGQDGVERIASVQHVILDKTGTLTAGRIRIAAVHFSDPANVGGRQELLRTVATLERKSGHAIAQAFAAHADLAAEISHYRVTPGAGLEATVDGSAYVLGSQAFVFDRASAVTGSLLDRAAASAGEGRSHVWVARDGEVLALIELGDTLHLQARHAVDTLRGQGLGLEILSGDHPGAVERVAAELELEDYRGGTTPEAKLARVEELEARGIRTAMIGDGVNDAAALSRATVGISAAGAAEVARDAADVFISASRGPEAVADVFRLARRAVRRIHINLGIAIAYNLTGAALAITGHITPLVAAVLMPLSSLTVLFLAVKR